MLDVLELSVKHGYYGGRLAQALRLPSSVVKIIERHVGAGITAEEARVLGLPNSGFIPETLEERIVTYADKRVRGEKVISCEEALEDLAWSLGVNHPAVGRLKSLFEEFFSLLGEDPCPASC